MCGFSSNKSSRYALGARWLGGRLRFSELMLGSRRAATPVNCGDPSGLGSRIVFLDICPLRESGRRLVRLIA
jgi:hypothetical protein